MNYRLLPAHAWPHPRRDLAAAIAWVRTNIAARGGDPDKIFLWAIAPAPCSWRSWHPIRSIWRVTASRRKAIRGVMPMGSIMWDDDLAQTIAKNGREAVAAGFAPRSARQGVWRLDAYEGQWPIRYVTPGLPPFCS
jgi:hypothetical protein